MRCVIEACKVVVVTQAVATFDVNAGWATSGDLTIRNYGRNPDGLGQRWLGSAVELQEGADVKVCTLVWVGAATLIWVHHLGPVLPSPSHGLEPMRLAMQWVTSGWIHLASWCRTALSWTSIRSPRVQFDLDQVQIPEK